MNIELIREYCLSKADTTEDSAFGPENILFRICGKIFAAIDLGRPDLIVVKCDPDEGIALCETYRGVRPAWHWNKRHWIEVDFNADVPDAMIRELVEKAYHLVVKHLPKKTLYHFPETPDGWKYVHFSRLDSVMNYMISQEADEVREDTLLITVDYQTNGRGQRGNRWDAESGANLLMGLRLRNLDFPARQQFCFNQTVSVAVAQAVGRFLGGTVEIKWPNDIYFKGRKLGGMLFEHTIVGDRIHSTNIGIGVNVNQRTFADNLPNPTSIALEYGKDLDRAVLLRAFVKMFQQWYTRWQAGLTGRTDLEYRNRLFRREGFHPYRDADGTFEAKLHNVTPEGCLQLQDSTGEIRTYAFKEVEYIL